MTLSYEQKLKSIRQFTTLGIKSKKHFSKKEKWLISRYYNIARESGYFDYNAKNNEFSPKVKFVKSKKKKQKGSPKFNGYFVQGANPGDKIRNGKIIKDNFEKIFIPLDFSDAIEAEAEFRMESPEDDFDYRPYIADEVETSLNDYYDDLDDNSYFTIVLSNGWEVGQNKKNTTAKNKRRDGQAIAADLFGQAKIDNLVDKIEELFGKAINKYHVEIIRGIYLWKFKNQRKPTVKEKSIIKKKKRKRKY